MSPNYLQHLHNRVQVAESTKNETEMEFLWEKTDVQINSEKGTSLIHS